MAQQIRAYFSGVSVSSLLFQENELLSASFSLHGLLWVSSRQLPALKLFSKGPHCLSMPREEWAWSISSVLGTSWSCWVVFFLHLTNFPEGRNASPPFVACCFTSLLIAYVLASFPTKWKIFSLRGNCYLTHKQFEVDNFFFCVFLCQILWGFGCCCFVLCCCFPEHHKWPSDNSCQELSYSVILMGQGLRVPSIEAFIAVVWYPTFSAHGCFFQDRTSLNPIAQAFLWTF